MLEEIAEREGMLDVEIITRLVENLYIGGDWHGQLVDRWVQNQEALAARVAQAAAEHAANHAGQARTGPSRRRAAGG